MKKEKVTLLAICLGTMGIELVAVIAEPAMPAFIRMFLTLLLCWFLYRGRNWARIIFGILMSIASITGLLTIAKLPYSDSLFLLIFMVAFYMLAIGLLFLYPPLKQLFFQTENENEST